MTDQDPIIYILTRTSRRPKFFEQNYRSIHEQTYPHLRHYVSCDDEETEKYVRTYDRVEVFPVKRIPRQGNGHFPYNLYLNQMIAKIPADPRAWVMFLDDDDVFTSPESIAEIVAAIKANPDPENMFFWQVQFPNRLVPKNLGRPPALGNISCIGFLFHYHWREEVQFRDRKGGDYYFAKDIWPLIQPQWIHSILTKINYEQPRRVGSGQRNDLNVLKGGKNLSRMNKRSMVKTTRTKSGLGNKPVKSNAPTLSIKPKISVAPKTKARPQTRTQAQTRAQPQPKLDLAEIPADSHSDSDSDSDSQDQSCSQDTFSNLSQMSSDSIENQSQPTQTGTLQGSTSQGSTTATGEMFNFLSQSQSNPQTQISSLQPEQSLLDLDLTSLSTAQREQKQENHPTSQLLIEQLVSLLGKSDQVMICQTSDLEQIIQTQVQRAVQQAFQTFPKSAPTTSVPTIPQSTVTPFQSTQSVLKKSTGQPSAQEQLSRLLRAQGVQSSSSSEEEVSSSEEDEASSDGETDALEDQKLHQLLEGKRESEVDDPVAAELNDYLDEIFIFNFHDQADELQSQFKQLGFQNVQIVDGNPKKTFYDNLWDLARLCKKKRYHRVAVFADDLHLHRDFIQEFQAYLPEIERNKWKLVALAAGQNLAPRAELDVEFYLEAYPDLQKSRITNPTKAKHHWKIYGSKEKRYSQRGLLHPDLLSGVSGVLLSDRIYDDLAKLKNSRDAAKFLIRNYQSSCYTTSPLLALSGLNRITMKRNRHNLHFYEIQP